jgi:hypothetical protein
MQDDSTIIYATAVLLSPGKTSVIDKKVTTENLAGLLPTSKAIATVRSFLLKKGFDVKGEGPTLTAAGKKGLFEKVFKFSVALKQVNNTTYATAATQPVIPTPIKPFVKTIVFSEPMEFFS